MAAIPESELVVRLSDVGNCLLQPPSSISELIKLLDFMQSRLCGGLYLDCGPGAHHLGIIMALFDNELEFLFTKMKQAPTQLVQEALVIPMKALIAYELFNHSDPNVRVTVASCLNEVMRISAPTPPYDDDKMKEIFELLVSSFEYLACEPGRCYSKAVLILHSVARLRSCVMMLDLDCDWLVTKMLELFMRNISPKHPQSFFLAMVKIMRVMIQESDPVSLELLKILIDNIKIENQNVSPVSWDMAIKILEECADKLRQVITELVSCMGICLEDYAPILASICKPEDDIATNIINDPPILGNNEPSGSLNHPAEYVQSPKATESCSGSKAVGIEGSTSKRGREANSHNLDEEAADLELKQAHQGSADDDISKKNESPKKDVALKRVKEGTGDFENDQVNHYSALDDRKGKFLKKDVSGVSGDKVLRKKNDVSGASGSSGKKLVRQTKESSGGTGNKSRTGPSRKDKVQLSDSSRNQRKRASSDDDEIFETPHGRKHYKDDLVGCRIKVWWPLDRRYYEGTITSFDASARKHRVDYDDGDEENLNLMKERWEFLGDETPIDIASLFDKKTSQRPSISSQDEPSKEEKKISLIHNDEKGIARTSGIEPADARDHATTPVVKSEIPNTLHEAKRPKLSDEQNS